MSVAWYCCYSRDSEIKDIRLFKSSFFHKWVDITSKTTVWVQTNPILLCKYT
jgi:hypothetical protein